ncbi:hypothetical protein ACE7GA_07905 [Roseomonas sp. CCTCC AB2023176]|uniref:hypothetical protein n=1 Tax=Roseomonas sp. CCTCC AB2023176 TaxID=3342640 RepID=UPI0035D65D49
MWNQTSMASICRLPALALLVMLAACASGATPGAMTPPISEATLISQNSALRSAVDVGRVTGGSETNPLLASSVSDADFATALRQSLRTHAMLALGGERFRLEATLLELRRPFGGFDLEVTAGVSYRLIRVADGQEVFTREIRNAYTAPFSSSFLAVERLRLANEGAVRENIRQLLSALVTEERVNPGAFSPGGRPGV